MSLRNVMYAFWRELLIKNLTIDKPKYKYIEFFGLKVCKKGLIFRFFNYFLYQNVKVILIHLYKKDRKNYEMKSVPSAPPPSPRHQLLFS